MAATRAPKQWSLGKVETVNTFNAWKDNLLYTLSLDTKFAPFLVTNYTWNKETTADPNRGFTDDAGTNDNPPTGMKKRGKSQKSQLVSWYDSKLCHSYLKKSDFVQINFFERHLGKVKRTLWVANIWIQVH